MQVLGEDSLAVNFDGAVWLPYKELFALIGSVVYGKDVSRIPNLDTALRKFRLDFLHLLKSPAKRSESREVVKKAATDGIRILGQQDPRVLSQTIVNEAIFISDLFDLNEVVALELLLTGESQQPRLSFLDRRLAAVLLYYDGRCCFVNSLRALIQARKGRCWTLDFAPEITDLATKYTDDLWKDGLRDQLFSHLTSFSPAREHERIESILSLGNAKQRKKIMDLIEEIHTSLAECLYCWSCQTGLVTADVLRLIAIVSEMIPNHSDGGLDSSQFTMILALLYSLDYEPLQSGDDFYDSVEVTALSDPDFISAVHKEIMSSSQWSCPTLKAAIQFAWAVSLGNLTRLPIAQGVRQQFDEEDELVLDMGLEGGALSFLRNSIVGNERFFTEEFFVRRIHGIVTDFVHHFPLKVKELRNRSDELARVLAQDQWTSEETMAPICFKELLELIAALYGHDAFSSELALDYWYPPDVQFGVRTTVYSPTQKQVNLYKFVRLCGDLLPPLLYVAYVDMLTGLAKSSMGARHCFYLLKSGGSGSGGGSGGGGPGRGGHPYIHRNIISWDHFFASLQRYLASLRQDQPAHTQRAMSPQELDGLCAFLRLTETIAANDDMSGHALAESADWAPLPTFVGLLTCCVPVILKAALVRALSAFAKSADASVVILQALEAARIVPSSASSEFHIRTELNEIESRNEEYPLTRAFIRLLTAFVGSFSSVEIRNLSTKFEACVLFVVDDVLSQFNLRSYKSVDEKWQVASCCLEFLIKLMTSSDEGTCLIRPTASTGGFRPVKLYGADLVLSYMLRDTRLFRTVMYVIDESLQVLTSYASVLGKKMLEKCALLSLRLVHSALERQGGLMAALREANADMIVAGLHQLLVSINQQSGKADFPTRIAKFATFNDSLPEHSFFAVSILSWISRLLTSQDQIIAAFLLNQNDANELRQGFVECLEADDDDDDVRNDVDSAASTVDETLSDSRTRSATRRSVLRLLIGCLNYPPPNLSAFFLGYDLYRPSLKTVLQDPGVLESPYTCMHAVIEILFRGDGKGLTVTRELCQRLVYTACTNPDTSLPTLRYLRTSHDLLFRLLRIVASRLQDQDQSHTAKDVHMSILNCQTWLLKTVAIEVRLLSASGQRSSLHRLTEALLSETGKSIRLDGGEMSASSELPLSASASPSVTYSRCLLLAILDRLDWSQTFPKHPQWEFFDAGVMEQLVVQCERQTADGYLAVDVQRLHRILLTEVGNLHGGGSIVQRPLIAEEIRSVLQYVVLRNRVRHELHSKRQAVDAWRLLTETVFLSIPVDAVHNVPVILELIHTLLQKILSESSLSELTPRASGVLLTLLVGLRRCFTMSSPVPAWTPFASSLEALLKGLLECVIQAGTGPAKLRVHYYGALISFLRLTGPSSSADGASDDARLRQTFVTRSIEIINSFGDSIYEILCSDACNTNDITKMMALCCLCILVSNDLSDGLLRHMATRGYLVDCVNSLRADDRHLQAIVTARTDDLRSLYIYETKLTFFIHLASRTKGAQLLLTSGFLEFLAEMRSFQMKPECGGELTSGESRAQLVSNYFQVLVPALKVSALLITSPVSKALEARSKVLNLLVSHVDCFDSLLREALSARYGTNEYAIVSAFVARGLRELGTSDSSPVAKSELARLSRLVQNLLPAVTQARRVVIHRRRSVRSEPTASELHDDLAWARATTSLLSFCVSIALSNDEDVRAQTFRPVMLVEDSTVYNAVLSLRSLPDLGLLVFLLKSCCEDLLKSERLWAGHETSSSSAGVSEISKQSRCLLVCIVEHALFMLYFHLEFYIIQSLSKRPLATRAEPTSKTSVDLPRLRRLQDFPFDESSTSSIRSTDVASASSRDVTFPLTLEAVATLQKECRQGLTDALVENVLQVSEHIVSPTKSRFMIAMVRRLRWILRLRLS